MSLRSIIFDGLEGKDFERLSNRRLGRHTDVGVGSVRGVVPGSVWFGRDPEEATPSGP